MADGNQPLSMAWLHERALRYLDRYDSSAANLRRVLLGAVRKASTDPEEREAAAAQIDAVVTRLREAGLIDDARFASVAARGLRSRGSSARMIRHKLRGKGLGDPEVDAALVAAEDERTELEAAREYVRRRRLGPHRPPDERSARARRDLAALARAGFSIDVARRALGTSAGEDETPDLDDERATS